MVTNNINNENQAKKAYTCEQDEMLEACIEMSLFLETHNLLKM